MINTQKIPPRSRVSRPEPASGTFAATIRNTMTRLNLDEPRAADYFGVPLFTFRKWASGERQPGAAVARLVEVLGMVEVFAPALHASFLPSESRHVEKSGRKGSTGSTHDSVMLKNPV
jgi:DNA-binding transcriptional regulator YiaG